MENQPIEIVRDAKGHYRKGNDVYGECETCDKTDTHITLHYGNMWMCEDCAKREAQLKITHQQEIAQVNTLHQVNQNVIAASRQIDQTMQVRPDLFNAATIAIVDLKKAIDDNAEITNKPYALAQELMSRFEHFKSVIFEANETIVQATNNQKAIQVYLNQLANTLRAEEREKLKIQDINYKPGAVKPVKPAAIKTSGIKKGKLDKAELRKYAAELGVSEFTLQMLCTSQGLTPEMAANKLRRSINEAKSESDNLPAEDMDSGPKDVA